jgi:cold-inducible RNA-binding protein
MKNLFVGNMSFQTTEADLRVLFEPFGQITRVHIGKDRETGRSRGFAFVEMANDDEAAKAMAALNGKEFGGRALKVNEATPRGDRPPSSGGRGPGGPRGGGSGGGGGRGRFSTEDYRDSVRQPREPRW